MSCHFDVSIVDFLSPALQATNDKGVQPDDTSPQGPLTHNPNEFDLI